MHAVCDWVEELTQTQTPVSLREFLDDRFLLRAGSRGKVWEAVRAHHIAWHKNRGMHILAAPLKGRAKETAAEECEGASRKRKRVQEQ